jgi:hypothetical protein
MMISYLLPTSILPQIISKNNTSHLLYLVGLGLRAVSLKIDLLLDAWLTEYVVTSTGALDKTK